MNESEDERSGLHRDLTKKILSLGLGAYFLTEDTVRRYVKDAKVPRDIGKLLTQNAAKGKEELYGFVGRELTGFLKQLDLQEELGRFFKRNKIRIKAEIDITPNPSQPGVREDPAESPSEAAEEASAPPIDWQISFGSGQSKEGEELSLESE